MKLVSLEREGERLEFVFADEDRIEVEGRSVVIEEHISDQLDELKRLVLHGVKCMEGASTLIRYLGSKGFEFEPSPSLIEQNS
jgi:hypothetical protein